MRLRDRIISRLPIFNRLIKNIPAPEEEAWRNLLKELKKHPRFKEYKKFLKMITAYKLAKVFTEKELNSLMKSIEPTIIELSAKRDHVKKLDEKIDGLRMAIDKQNNMIKNGFEQLIKSNESGYDRMLQLLHNVMTREVIETSRQKHKKGR